MRHLGLIGGAVIALAAAAAPAWAQAPPAPPAPATGTDWVLDNGLRVWLHPVSKAKHTAVVVVYEFGEQHDPKGQSGLAHLLDQCYVTAAAGDRPARTMEAWTAAVPVARRAKSGRDHTVFAEVVDRSQALAALAEAADRMGALRITQADLDRERPRVEHELTQMYEGVPYQVALNAAREHAWPSPAGARRGGVLADVRTLTVEQLQARWAAHYKPASARLLVSGSFHKTKVRELIAERFGAIPAGDGVPAVRPPEPARLGERVDLQVTPSSDKLPGIAVLAVRVPDHDGPHFAPFCLALTRCWMLQVRFKGKRVVAQYAPLDLPEVAQMITGIHPGETPAAAVARLEKFLSEAFGLPFDPVERGMALNYFASTLGTGRIARPDEPTALYHVALRHARMGQLGLDAGKMIRTINGVTAETFGAMRAAVFAPAKRVVVTAGLKTE